MDTHSPPPPHAHAQGPIVSPNATVDPFANGTASLPITPTGAATVDPNVNASNSTVVVVPFAQFGAAYASPWSGCCSACVPRAIRIWLSRMSPPHSTYAYRVWLT